MLAWMAGGVFAVFIAAIVLAAVVIRSLGGALRLRHRISPRTLRVWVPLAHDFFSSVKVNDCEKGSTL